MTSVPLSPDGVRRGLVQAGVAAVVASAAGAATGRGAGRDRAEATVAATTSGRVRGQVDNGILAFKGVRYGADTAPRRFKPPAPPQPWSDILDADAFGPVCPQTGTDEPRGEDCLFLNVWTPGLRGTRARPVMIYIHGGAYSSGSGSSPLTDGARLSRRGDVVVVTLNHRLNALGYLSLGRFGGPAFADSGNVGMLDLVLALTWVRDNIGQFGGDPGKVTLFGQSGGGAKIATLMAMPSARGLFHRVATMSGQQVTASGPLHAEQRARAYLSALDLAPDRLGPLLDLPWPRLVEALNAKDPILGGGVYFGPVVDGRSLPRHPFYPDAPALSSDVPMIIGNTHDETRLLIGRSDPSLFSLGWDALPGRLVAEMRADIEPAIVVAAYRELHPAYSPTDVFFAATTASRSWRGALIEAELRARQGVPAHVYQLDWGSPVDGGKWGAYHTLDIPLVFDTVDVPQSGAGAAGQPVADQMSASFIAFARTGDPNTPMIPKWDRYTLPGRATLIFNNRSRLVHDPRGAERRLFASVPFTQAGT